MTSRGRVLALDVGERRIGVAICDPSWLLASPYTTLQATPEAVFYKKLQHIVAVEDIVQLVVGLPVSLNGHEGPQAQRIRHFIDALMVHIHIPIATCDERYTSAAAERLMIEAGMRPEQRKARIDEVAASIILQDWIDAQRNQLNA
ncbi:MAG: Holliday junction resolvase RuvX [Roseiflexaceae bacterium]|jgi:putative holliday junction resolvase|nr:Holliday junction resolvase RuvX [Chloroflexaceae bacterium]